MAVRFDPTSGPTSVDPTSGDGDVAATDLEGHGVGAPAGVGPGDGFDGVRYTSPSKTSSAGTGGALSRDEAVAQGRRAVASVAFERREVQALLATPIETPEQAQRLTRAIRGLAVRLRMQGPPDATVRAELDGLATRALKALGAHSGLTLEPHVAKLGGRSMLVRLDVHSTGGATMTPSQAEIASLARELVYGLGRMRDAPQTLDGQTVYLLGMRDALWRRSLRLPDAEHPDDPTHFDSVDQASIQKLLATINDLVDEAPDLPKNLLEDLGAVSVAAVQAPAGDVRQRILDALDRAHEVGTPASDAAQKLHEQLLDEALAPAAHVSVDPLRPTSLDVPDLAAPIGDLIDGYAEVNDRVRADPPSALPFGFVTPVPIEYVGEDGNLVRMAAGTGIVQAAEGDFEIRAPALELQQGHATFLLQDGVIRLGNNLGALDLGTLRASGPNLLAALDDFSAQVDGENHTALITASSGVVQLDGANVALEDATIAYGPTGELAATFRSLALVVDDVHASADNLQINQTGVGGAPLIATSGDDVHISSDHFALQAGHLSGTLQDGDWLLQVSDATYGWGDGDQAVGDATVHVFETEDGGKGFELLSDNIAFDWDGRRLTSVGEGGSVQLLQGTDGHTESVHITSPDLTYGDGDPAHMLHIEGGDVLLSATTDGYTVTGDADRLSWGQDELALEGLHDVTIASTGDTVTRVAGQADSVVAHGGDLTADNATLDVRFNPDGTLSSATALAGSVDWRDGDNLVTLRDGASLSIDHSQDGRILLDAGAGHAVANIDGQQLELLEGSGHLSIDEATGTMQLVAGAEALTVQGSFGRIEVDKGVTVNLLAVDGERIEVEAIAGKAHLLLDDGSTVDVDEGRLSLRVDEKNAVAAAELSAGHASLHTADLGTIAMADDVTVDLRTQDGVGAHIAASAGSVAVQRDGQRFLVEKATATLAIDEAAGTLELTARAGSVTWHSPDGHAVSGEGLSLRLLEKDGILSTFFAELNEGTFSGPFGGATLDGGVEGVTLQGAFSEGGTRLSSAQLEAGHIGLTSTDAFGRTSSLSLDESSLSLTSEPDGTEVLQFATMAAGALALGDRTLTLDSQGQQLGVDVTTRGGKLTQITASLPGLYSLAGEGESYWLESTGGGLTQTDERTDLHVGFDRGGFVLDRLTGNVEGVALDASSSELDAKVELTVGEAFLKDTSLSEKYFGGEVEVVGVRLLAEATDHSAHGRVEIGQLAATTSDYRVLLRNPQGRTFAIDVEMSQQGEDGSRVAAAWELVEGGTIQILGDDLQAMVGGHTGSLEVVRAPGSDTSTLRFDSKGLDAFVQTSGARVQFDSQQVTASLGPDGLLLETAHSATLDAKLDGVDVHLDIADINNQLAELGAQEGTYNGRPMKVAGLILHPPEAETGNVSATLVVDYNGVPLRLDFRDMGELRAFAMAGDNMIRFTIDDPTGRGSATIGVGDYLQARGKAVDFLVRYRTFDPHRLISDLGLLLQNDGIEYLPGVRVDEENHVASFGPASDPDARFGVDAQLAVRFSNDPNDPPVYAMTQGNPNGDTELSAMLKVSAHGTTGGGKRRHRASFFVGAGQAAAVDFMVLQGNLEVMGHNVGNISLPANFTYGVGYATETQRSRQQVSFGGFCNEVGRQLEQNHPGVVHEPVTQGLFATAEHTSKVTGQSARMGMVVGQDADGKQVGAWVHVGLSKRFGGAQRQRLSFETDDGAGRQTGWLRSELPDAEPVERLAPTADEGPQATGADVEQRTRALIATWRSSAPKKERREALEAGVAEILRRPVEQQVLFFNEMLEAGLFEDAIDRVDGGQARADLLGRLALHAEMPLVGATVDRLSSARWGRYARVRRTLCSQLAREPVDAVRAAVVGAVLLDELPRPVHSDHDFHDQELAEERDDAQRLLALALQQARGLEATRAVMRAGCSDEVLGALESLRGEARDRVFARLATEDASGFAADRTDGQVFRLLGARMIDEHRVEAFERMLDAIPEKGLPVMLASLEPEACEQLFERLDGDRDWNQLATRIGPEMRAEIIAVLHNPRLRAAYLASLNAPNSAAQARFAIGQKLRAIKKTQGVWVHVPPQLAADLRNEAIARAVLAALDEVDRQIHTAKLDGKALDADVDLALRPPRFVRHDPATWDLDPENLMRRRPLIAAQLSAVDLRLQGDLPLELLSRDPELCRGLIAFVDFIASQPETLRNHGVAAIHIGAGVGGFFSSEAKVRTCELGKDANGNARTVGVLEVDDSVLRGFAAPEGSEERAKAIEQINEPLREQEEAKLVSLDLTVPVAGTDGDAQGSLRVSPFGARGPSATLGADATGDESVGLSFHQRLQRGNTTHEVGAGLAHADDELALSVGVKARRLLWQTDNDYLGTFASGGLAVGEEAATTWYARVGLFGQLAGKAGVLQYELGADPLSLRAVYWEVECDTKYSDDQKAWAIVKLSSMLGPAAGVGINGTELAIGPLGVEFGEDGGRKLVLSILPPFIYLHGQAVELSKRYLGPFPDIGSLEPRGMSNLPPEVVDGLFEDYVSEDGIVAGVYELRKTIEDHALGHQMVAMFAAIEEGKPGAREALQSWLGELRTATLIDRYLAFHHERPKLDEMDLIEGYARYSGGKKWTDASEAVRKQFTYYVQKTENWRVFSQRFANHLDSRDELIAPALEHFRAAVVGHDAAAKRVRAKLDLPDVADDGLALMGALAETRKAVQAARMRLTSFDASLRGQLASAGDERATIEAMRAELREWSEELGKVIEKVGKLSRRAQRERGPDDLRDIDDDHREILGELSKLLVGTGDRASDGLLAGGSKWEETLYALQEAGRNDLVTPLNLELWRLKRDPTLWALVRPARQEPDDLSGPTVSGEASRRAVRRPLLRPSQSDDRSAP